MNDYFIKVSDYVAMKKIKLQKACYNTPKDDAWKTNKSWQMTNVYS